MTNITFATVRDLVRSNNIVFGNVTVSNSVIITKQGKPRCFIVDYSDFENYKKYKEWIRLSLLDPEEIINEIQNININSKNIPPLEDQLNDI